MAMRIGALWISIMIACSLLLIFVGGVIGAIGSMFLHPVLLALNLGLFTYCSMLFVRFLLCRKSTQPTTEAERQTVTQMQYFIGLLFVTFPAIPFWFGAFAGTWIATGLGAAAIAHVLWPPFAFLLLLLEIRITAPCKPQQSSHIIPVRRIAEEKTTVQG